MLFACSPWGEGECRIANRNDSWWKPAAEKKEPENSLKCGSVSNDRQRSERSGERSGEWLRMWDRKGRAIDGHARVGCHCSIAI